MSNTIKNKNTNGSNLFFFDRAIYITIENDVVQNRNTFRSIITSACTNLSREEKLNHNLFKEKL